MTVTPQPTGRSEHATAARRALERELALIARQGPTRVAELCLAAMRGDRTASSLPLGAMLRALPGIDWLTAHDMLLRAGVPHDDTPLGRLNGPQRAALGAELARIPAPRP